MAHLWTKLTVTVFLGLAGAGLLTACENTRASNPFEEVARKNLRDYSYDAADDLVFKSRSALSPSTPILVGTLTNVDKLERSSTFGRMVTEQVSSRMVQRGFNVTELKMRNSVNIKEGLADPSESGEYLLSRDIQSIGGEHAAGGVVTGTYAVAGNEIYVNLKMINVSTGKLIAATDYNVPLTSNIRELVESDVNYFYGSSYAY